MCAAAFGKATNNQTMNLAVRIFFSAIIQRTHSICTAKLVHRTFVGFVSASSRSRQQWQHHNVYPVHVCPIIHSISAFQHSIRMSETSKFSNTSLIRTARRYCIYAACCYRYLVEQRVSVSHIDVI